MSTRIRKEEYATLGDFIKTSFMRDQQTIMQRFPKLNEQFLTTFNEKLEKVKTLESKSVLTHQQKTTTASLYHEAGILNKELNFLSNYIASAELDTRQVTDLKNDLTKNNIEGAIIKIEGLKQFITAHLGLLTEEGMPEDFVTTLDTHKTSLAEKNAQQNAIMNSSKTVTDTNAVAYADLYDMITKIADAGKLVFDDTVTENEYVITKIIGRMRAPKHTQENQAGNN